MAASSVNLKTTAIVPAFNEEEGIADTLDSLLAQDKPFHEIVVVDDGSSDWTPSIVFSYRKQGVTLIRTPVNLGSKAKAQNYGLEQLLQRPKWGQPDLVIPVDADTVFAENYVDLIERPFEDPTVAIAAGAVQTRFTKSIWERARWIEYHVGFHWFRPIQNQHGAPMVCSGCCSAFRLSFLEEFGGFPERTIVEDIDYTWSQQIMGRRAVYVGDAVAYAAEPVNMKYMRKQLWRWKSGFMQNVRQHYPDLLKRKRALALWVTVAMLETLLSPVTMAVPLWWLLVDHNSVWSVVGWTALSETILFTPATLYAWRKRGTNPLQVLVNYPAFFVLKFLNFYYDWKAMVNELVLFPFGWSKGLHDYEKGRADTPGILPAVEAPKVLHGRHRAVGIPVEDYVPLTALLERM